MARPEYLNMLTPGERAAALKLGIAHKLVAVGLRPSDCDAIIKGAAIAAEPTDLIKGLGQTWLLASLIVGAPLGAAWHKIDQKIQYNPSKEKERLARIKYYKDVAHQLESGLAAAGA